MPALPPSPEQLIAMLEGALARIAALTEGLTPQQLREAPAEGEWSAVQVLAHLRSCADMWGDAIARIMAEDHPTIRAVNPTTWIKQTNYRDLEFKASLRAYTRQRAELVALLRALPPEAWERAATVKGAGKTLVRTVRFYVEWLANHERPHIKQIGRAAEAVRE